QLFTADVDNIQTAGANILQRTNIEQTEARYIQRSGQDVGGHIGYQGFVAHLGNPVEFHTTDGLVGRVVHVGSIVGQLPFVLAGNRKIVIFLGRGGDVDVAVAGGFLDGLARPDAGVDVIGTAVLTEQVQRDLRDRK